MTAENRLAKLGIHLPDAPTPFGAYLPAIQTGNLLFLSGMLATSGHTATAVGIVGKDLDAKAGGAAACTAALNVLALTKSQLGSLNRVSHVVMLGVYVAATPEFTEHPKIADAASELLQDVFGEETVSSRLVFGVVSLPLGSPVELEVILEVKNPDPTITPAYRFARVSNARSNAHCEALITIPRRVRPLMFPALRASSGATSVT
jgi:enamine deaminase RidA (YjgF/YER057c/UK114 family)